MVVTVTLDAVCLIVALGALGAAVVCGVTIGWVIASRRGRRGNDEAVDRELYDMVRDHYLTGLRYLHGVALEGSHVSLDELRIAFDPEEVGERDKRLTAWISRDARPGTADHPPPDFPF